MDDLQKVSEYIKNNTIPTALGSECVDGRNEPKGRMARPGGHLGYVMVLLALNKELNLGLNPKQAFDKVYDFVTKAGEPFDMHSDTHADPGKDNHEEHHHGPIIGCGHAAKSTNRDFSHSYNLNPDEMVEVINYSREKIKNGDNIRFDILNGEHKEEGVLVVTGKDKTVKHFDGNKMFFVYDKTRDDEFIEKLVKELNIPGVTVEKFKKLSDKQTQATLHILAEGKNIYRVSYEGENPTVEILGIVE